MKKPKHNIETVISERIKESEKESAAEFAKIAEDVLKKIMPEVKLNGKEEPTEICVTFTDNEEIRKINAEFRQIDRATDVLSFPVLELFDGTGEINSYDYNPETGGLPLGDIIISTEKVKEQAEEYGHSVKRETAFLVCHGLLHLSGYDHMEPEREMIMTETAEKLLTAAGYSRETMKIVHKCIDKKI